MKILVFSDSHRALGTMYDAIERLRPDAVIHLGDHLEDAESMESVFSGVDFYHVPGNCDFFTNVPPSLTVSLDGVRVFLTHGHLFGVKSGLTRLALEARRVGAQLALFGHTHRALLEEQDGLWLMNPGACGAGRSAFGEIITDEHGGFTCRLRNAEEMEEHDAALD